MGEIRGMITIRKERFSILKGMMVFYLFLLVIFFAVTPFLAMLLYWETDFSRSMLPVLIGFCLQGIFLVMVFAIYQYDTTMKSRQNNKLLLRGMITPLLHAALAQEGQTSHSTLGGMPAPGHLAQAIEALRNGTLPESSQERLRHLFTRSAYALESMTAVAVQIDAQHMAAWTSIFTALNAFEEAEEAPARQAAVIQLLERAQWFDELPL